LEEEVVAHHEAEVDLARIGDDQSSDTEYHGEEAAEDEAAAECPPFVFVLGFVIFFIFYRRAYKAGARGGGCGSS
jgi:hypothetical protein